MENLQLSFLVDNNIKDLRFLVFLLALKAPFCLLWLFIQQEFYNLQLFPFYLLR